MSVGTSFDFKDARQFMSDAKFYEGYSRYIPELNRYETWEESVSRVMNMHRKFFTSKGKLTPELEAMIQEVQESYNKKEFLGAQRALQFGGDQLLKHHAKLYNCIGTPVDRVEAFGEIMYWSLCGCGVGYSIQNHHIAKLPKVMPRLKQAKVYTIPDSIEGWSESIDILLSSFFENGGKHPEYSGRKIYFDSTKIREKGSLISGGFKAPGPEPLTKALNKIENILIHVSEQKRQLKSIEIHDIITHCLDAVISGGVRRAALICLFSKNDEDMINAKTGNWFQTNPQRARANNSVVLKRDETTFEEFKAIVERAKQFGEPGFYFTDDIDILTNPCVSGDTIINIKNPNTKEIQKITVKEFVEQYGKKYHTYDILTYDFKNNEVVYKNTNGAALTKRNTKILKITDTKTKKSVKVTPDHKIYTKNRGWIEAQHLKQNDELVIN